MKEELISFETARLLKEKKWSFPTLNFYFEDGQSKENVLEQTTGMDYGSEFTVEYEELIENWNDNFLTKKNGHRCFGCDKNKGYFETYSAPTQALLQKWLREIHNIHICNNLHYKVNGGVAGYLIDISHPNGDFKGVSTDGITYEEALEKGLYTALKLINL